jgi:hypothetical protein
MLESLDLLSQTPATGPMTLGRSSPGPHFPPYHTCLIGAGEVVRDVLLLFPTMSSQGSGREAGEEPGHRFACFFPWGPLCLSESWQSWDGMRADR